MTQRDWRIMREEFEIHVTGARSINPLRTWDEAAIDPSIRKAIDKLGYDSIYYDLSIDINNQVLFNDKLFLLN